MDMDVDMPRMYCSLVAVRPARLHTPTAPNESEVKRVVRAVLARAYAGRGLYA
jgi:hypothetical protein